ncbi:hypothetical protein CONPUDRAFT_70993 [Coniophora puteana RWD-64-598 SS2]|uniref:Uncharacterized protein n=1 Tax=Coniophora puteana (strain RWD-64-598) TaxID=741705 RepID=A0A5M3MYC3_CONPW|nr:uncharacterized protein CONPUDRAFT_70993 [Coniophora puteana RWD-64-598 SS2]EIW84148.1 hypothetical protein CONPUDRAFT_70993 [Coniophora puteana RWD-64-598 SS2]
MEPKKKKCKATAEDAQAQPSKKKLHTPKLTPATTSGALLADASISSVKAPKGKGKMIKVVPKAISKAPPANFKGAAAGTIKAPKEKKKVTKAESKVIPETPFTNIKESPSALLAVQQQNDLAAKAEFQATFKVLPANAKDKPAALFKVPKQIDFLLIAWWGSINNLAHTVLSIEKKKSQWLNGISPVETTVVNRVAKCWRKPKKGNKDSLRRVLPSERQSRVSKLIVPQLNWINTINTSQSASEHDTTQTEND